MGLDLKIGLASYFMEIYFYKTSSELKELNKDCELIEHKECSLINDTDRTNPSLIIDKSLINSNIIFIPSFGRRYNLASVERVNNNWVRANYHVDLLMSFKDELLEKYFLIDGTEFTKSNIVALMNEKSALGITVKEERSTSQYNARGEYTNYFYKVINGYFNDLSENSVVFTLE